MFLRRKDYYLFFLILLCSSCSMMQKFNIEKRRYRPGFYVDKKTNSAISFTGTESKNKGLADSVLQERTYVVIRSNEEHNVVSASSITHNNIPIKKKRNVCNKVSMATTSLPVKLSNSYDERIKAINHDPGNLSPKQTVVYCVLIGALIIITVCIALIFPAIEPDLAALIAIGIETVIVLLIYFIGKLLKKK